MSEFTSVGVGSYLVTQLDVRTERVDDIPVLVRLQQQMGFGTVLNDVIRPHGNRKGLSVGALATTWLSFILSQGDHRMERVEPWAATHLETLSTLLDEPVAASDFADDRLADVLRLLSQDALWEQIETRLGAQLLRIYDLRDQPVRLDSTTAALYHDAEGTTLFRKGHSKDHRPDLAQLKVMLASLDPLGLPLMTLVVAGNTADDRLYLPAVERARHVLGHGAQLYIGDLKMSALVTRATLAAAGDFYLTPEAPSGRRPDRLSALLERVWSKQQRLEPIRTTTESTSGEAATRLVALGFETRREREAMVNGEPVTWDERVLVVYSLGLARSEREQLRRRLARAEAEIVALTPPPARGRRRATRDEIEAKAAAVVKKHRVEGMLRLEIDEHSDPKQRLEARALRVEAAIARARREMGWRVYLTNAAHDRLPLVDAMLAYRGASRIERNFSRLKGRPLGLRPLWVQREDHACGMVRLLSLGLRVLAGVEFVVRAALKRSGETMAGLYAGNPARATRRPTTERVLEAFRGVTLAIIEVSGQTLRHVTPLSQLQHRILRLLGLETSLYDVLAVPPPTLPP
jgi:transposase